MWLELANISVVLQLVSTTFPLSHSLLPFLPSLPLSLSHFVFVPVDLTLRCLMRSHKHNSPQIRATDSSHCCQALPSQLLHDDEDHLKNSCLKDDTKELVSNSEAPEATPLPPPPPPPPPPTLSPLSCPPPLCVRGILVALCCHHRCCWKNFAGREFFIERGFSPIDFHLICHMTSWGVCGVRPDSKSAIESKDFPPPAPPPPPPPPPPPTQPHPSPCSSLEDGDNEAPVGHLEDTHASMASGYIPHPKEAIGLKCKRLLDIARIRYLRGCGYSAKLVYYVDRSTSLENVLLVAVPNESSTVT